MRQPGPGVTSRHVLGAGVPSVNVVKPTIANPRVDIWSALPGASDDVPVAKELVDDKRTPPDEDKWRQDARCIDPASQALIPRTGEVLRAGLRDCGSDR
jgi:hypothetical protein